MSLLNPLNPAAGGVPLPEDQREIDAAIRAGVVSYRVFPYMDWRYAERGEKFARSDSAWLAWLTRHPQEQVDEQIAWLRDVLSNRGMPSWILERHLEVLYRQLARTIPDKEQKYVRLRNSADRLRQISESNMPTHYREQLVQDFAASFRPSSHPLIKNAARLLVAALADEKSGVKNAVSSLRTWLGNVATLRELKDLRQRLSPTECRMLDSDSFEKQWVAAVEATIDQARGGRREPGLS